MTRKPVPLGDPVWREPDTVEMASKPGPRWYLRVPPGRWFDAALYMINTRKRGRKGKSVAYMVHRRRNIIDTSGFTTLAWEYVTYTLTLDDAKSVAQLLYASQQE